MTFILPLPAWRKAKSLFSRYVAAFRLTRFAEQQGIQLIHTSDSWFNPYLLRVSQKLGIPSVSHVRTPIRPDQVKNYRFKEVSMIISISERFKPPFLVTLSGGSIVFEAMACGKPVILVRKMPPSNVSWEIVRDGETGFVIPHEEAQPLAGAMMRLIDDPALQRRMGREGRRWAEERFSHIQMARQTQESYDRLVHIGRNL